MIPGLGSLTNSGSMPITGGAATATATNTTNAGQNVGGISMGSSNRGGVNLWVIGGIGALVLAYVVLKK